MLTRLRVLGQVFSYVFRLWRELGRLRPAAVYCNDMRGLLTVGIAARLRRIPVMTWDKLDKPHGLLDWFQLPLVNRNLVISRAVTVKYPAWQRRLFRRRIRVVPNGVDIEAIEAARPADLGLPGDGQAPVVGMSAPSRPARDRIVCWRSGRGCWRRVPRPGWCSWGRPSPRRTGAGPRDCPTVIIPRSPGSGIVTMCPP